MNVQKVGLLALFVLAAVGCKPEKTGTSETAVTDTAAQTTQAEAPRELTLYSGRSESLVAPLIEKFEASSGITVKVKYGNSAELAGTIAEEGDKSPADIFWAQDAGTLGVLSAKGMLAELPTEVSARVDEKFRSPGGEWVATSGRARVLAYNTKNLKPEDLPSDVDGLLDKKWKGKIGWAPENASFQAFVAAMIELRGAEETAKWLAGMMANEPKTYPKNTPAVEATSTGEVDVALVNHYYLYRLKAEHGDDYPVENHFFASAKSGSLVNVSGVSRLKTAPNAEAAQKFVEYLLSEEAQSYFASETYEYPVVSSVKPHGNLPPLADIKAPKVDFGKLANLEATVKLLREAKAMP